MPENAADVITGRLENVGGIIHQIRQPLHRPVEIGRRRVGKKEMLKRFRNKLPAPDERVAQDQGGIVPDKIVPKRRRVEAENQDGQKKSGKDFFHEHNSVGQKQ